MAYTNLRNRLKRLEEQRQQAAGEVKFVTVFGNQGPPSSLPPDTKVIRVTFSRTDEADKADAVCSALSDF